MLRSLTPACSDRDDCSILEARDVERSFAPESWQHAVFREFLESAQSPDFLPTAESGQSKDGWRFVFEDDLTADAIAPKLETFLKTSANLLSDAALIVFSQPKKTLPFKSYYLEFWKIISELCSLDIAPWPAHTPREPHRENWQFCFGGEPIFVRCNNPAYVNLRSRYASSFMFVFMPVRAISIHISQAIDVDQYFLHDWD
jgi:uncharacterized protein